MCVYQCVYTWFYLFTALNWFIVLHEAGIENAAGINHWWIMILIIKCGYMHGSQLK